MLGCNFDCVIEWRKISAYGARTHLELKGFHMAFMYYKHQNQPSARWHISDPGQDLSPNRLFCESPGVGENYQASAHLGLQDFHVDFTSWNAAQQSPRYNLGTIFAPWSLLMYPGSDNRKRQANMYLESRGFDMASETWKWAQLLPTYILTNILHTSKSF